MKYRFKILSLITIIVLYSSCRKCENLEVFTFSKVLDKMNLENKDKSILIFYSRYCQPCDILAKDVAKYTSQEMEKMAVITLIDIDVAGNKIINQLTNSYSMPLTLIVDKELNLMGGVTGILDSPKHFKNRIDSILSNKSYILNISNRDSLSRTFYMKLLENIFKAKYSFEKNERDNVLNYLNIADSIKITPYTIYLRAKVERLINNRQDVTDSLLRATLLNVNEFTEYIYEDILNEIEFMLRNDSCEKIGINSIAFSNRSHDFGIVELNSKNEAQFCFSNIGNDSLLITNVRLSCNCIEAQYSNGIIYPKNDGYCTIIYKADKIGITSSIAVIEFSNGDSYPIIIRGEVVGDNKIHSKVF